MSDRYIPSMMDRSSFMTPTPPTNDHYQRALREHLLGSPGNAGVFSYTHPEMSPAGPTGVDWTLSGTTRSVTSTLGGEGEQLVSPSEEDATTHNRHSNSTPPSTPRLVWPSSPPLPYRQGPTPPVTPDHLDESRRLLTRTPPAGQTRQSRKSQINTSPSKALDAPEMCLDPHYSLLDWCANNTIIVLIGSVLYGWSATTSQIDVQITLQQSSAGEVTVIKSISDTSGTLVFGYADGTIEVRTGRTLELAHVYPREELDSYVAAISTCGHMVAVGCDSGALAVFDIRTKEPRAKALNRSAVTGGISSLQWSPEGNHLAVGGNSGEVSVWHLTSELSRPSTVLPGHDGGGGPVRSLAWHPQQRGVLASAGVGDGKVCFYNILSVTPCLGSYLTSSGVYAMYWSRNSPNEMVTAHMNHRCVVWGVRLDIDIARPPLIEIQRLKDHAGPVVYLVPSPDGENIATLADETMRLWMGIFPPVPKKSKIPLFGGGGTDLR